MWPWEINSIIKWNQKKTANTGGQNTQLKENQTWTKRAYGQSVDLNKKCHWMKAWIWTKPRTWTMHSLEQCVIELCPPTYTELTTSFAQPCTSLTFVLSKSTLQQNVIKIHQRAIPHNVLTVIALLWVWLWCWPSLFLKKNLCFYVLLLFRHIHSFFWFAHFVLLCFSLLSPPSFFLPFRT